MDSAACVNEVSSHFEFQQLNGLFLFLPPQVYDFALPPGPAANQRHHHLPQRGQVHPAKDHPEVRAPSLLEILLFIKGLKKKKKKKKNDWARGFCE